jgi:hypothetical protein
MVSAVVSRSNRKSTPSAGVHQPGGASAVDMARDIVARHGHFFGRTNNFAFTQCDDVLVIQGCVPTFYLKQVLQQALKGLDGVRHIDNRVDVVASDGLSSVRNQ